MEGVMHRILRWCSGLFVSPFCAFVPALCALIALTAAATPLRAQALQEAGAGGFGENAPRFLANLPSSAAWAPLDPARTPKIGRAHV